MPDITDYHRIKAAVEVVLQRRDELQEELDSLNADLQEYSDQLETLEELLDLDVMDIELDRLTNAGFSVYGNLEWHV